MHHSLSDLQPTFSGSQTLERLNDGVCEKPKQAKWIHLAAVGEKTSETPFTLKSAAHAWGLCSSSEAFHKNTIHICTQIRREYPKPRPWVLCTQAGIVRNTELLLWRGMPPLPLDKTARVHYTCSSSHTQARHLKSFISVTTTGFATTKKKKVKLCELNT